MKGKKRNTKPVKELKLMDAENLTTYEVEAKVEDLYCSEEEQDMITEDEFDDSNVTGREKLF